MKNKSKHGGARKGAGRKPVDDPKVPLTIQVRQSVIDKHGGMDATRRKAEDLLSNPDQ